MGVLRTGSWWIYSYCSMQNRIDVLKSLFWTIYVALADDSILFLSSGWTLQVWSLSNDWFHLLHNSICTPPKFYLKDFYSATNRKIPPSSTNCTVCWIWQITAPKEKTEIKNGFRFRLQANLKKSQFVWSFKKLLLISEIRSLSACQASSRQAP